MKKVMMICLVIIILSGCTNLNNHVRYEDVSDFRIVDHKFMGSEGVYGYIMSIDDEKALIVGMNINHENEQLAATWVSLEYQEMINDGTEVGTKVKYIADGLTLTSYPGYGGIKIIEILKDGVIEATTSEATIIKKVIIALKELSDKNSYLLYCINNIVYKDHIWEVQVVEDKHMEEGFTYYKIYINDETLEAEEIIVYE